MHWFSVAPMRNDNNARGSTMPPREKTPVLESVVAKPMNKAARLKLEALKAAVKRNQEAPEKF